MTHVNGCRRKRPWVRSLRGSEERQGEALVRIADAATDSDTAPSQCMSELLPHGTVQFYLVIACLRIS
jgi:hypothetical protein